MPTIDELAPVVAVSDPDELIVSQSGIVRKATRSQLMSGLQASLAVPSGNLLGRMSLGVGAPETIAIGANLVLANGTISAPPAFNVSANPVAGPVRAADLVPLGQGGQNTAVSYGSFMGGLAGIDGVDGSGLLAFVAGGAGGRRIADILADAVTVESFGAVGDGVTDDSIAFGRAIASGRALRLDGRVYVVNAALVIDASPAMLGVPGVTLLSRALANGNGPWITIAAPSFVANGVTFDAGSLVALDSACVTVAASCLSATFSGCGFIGAYGNGNGCGLNIAGAVGSAVRVRDSFARGNGAHGILVTGSGGVTVTGTICGGNGGDGIQVAGGVQARLAGNVCIGNTSGIALGNWAGEAPPSDTGLATIVSDNVCQANRSWGLALAMNSALVSGNVLIGNGTIAVGGGIRMLLAGSRVAGNMVTGGDVGIDARGSARSAVVGNQITGAAIGVLTGGSQALRVAGNVLSGNIWGIFSSAIEPTLSGVPTALLALEANDIMFTSAQGGGIAAIDGVQGLSVTHNRIMGSGSATINQALWLHTDTAIAFGNSWNNVAQQIASVSTVSGVPAIVVPDVADTILVIGAGTGIESIMTAHQVDTLGQITFIKMSNGGSGYTTASVTIAGAGSGAAAKAIISDGSIVWIVVANPGSGYGSIGAAVSVTIQGDGVGATAVGYVGLPVLDGRKLRVVANAALRFVRDGSSPHQDSWSGYDFTVPANGAAEFEGVFGEWRAVSSPPVDYIQPTGDGGAIVQSVSGAVVTLRPGAGGVLAVASGDEPAGYLSCVGRGSPEGLVAAPAGSDFRNLDGGAGTTLWLKQTGNDVSGWQALA